MQPRLLLLSCLLVPLAALAEDEEELKAAMAAGTRANLAAYDVIAPPKADIPVIVRIKLGETTSKHKEETYDGFRITAPDDVSERDFVWYFNAPQNWANWFIVPVTGDFEGGFLNWLNADRLYSDLDKPQEKNRTRALQTLDSSYFKPGGEYILWFRQVSPDEGAAPDLRAVYRFVARPAAEGKWDHDSIEKALKLKDAPAAEQVAELGSRGGRIMLDPQLFAPEDASSRIENVLFSIRQTRHHSSGIFITTEMSCPPCRRSPTLAAIREKFGPADFVQTAAEVRKVYKRAGDDTRKDDEDPVTTHYYDYFAFEVAESDPDGKVLQVKTHANDFSRLKPPAVGGFFGVVPMKNLTALYQDGKEVGRVYYFMEGGKEPLFIQEPPPGKYENEGMILEYQDGGNWLLLTMHEGKLVRRVPFARHRMNGIAEGFYANGETKFKASYTDGELHGEVIQYSEAGKVIDRRRFIDGEQVKDEDKNVPRKAPAKAAEPKTKPKPL